MCFCFFPHWWFEYDRKPSRVTPFFPHFSREDQWYKYLMPSQPQPTTRNLRCCGVWWECCVTVAMPLGQNAPQQMRLLGVGWGCCHANWWFKTCCTTRYDIIYIYIFIFCWETSILILPEEFLVSSFHFGHAVIHGVVSLSQVQIMQQSAWN